MTLTKSTSVATAMIDLRLRVTACDRALSPFHHKGREFAICVRLCCKHEALKVLRCSLVDNIPVVKSHSGSIAAAKDHRRRLRAAGIRISVEFYQRFHSFCPWWKCESKLPNCLFLFCFCLFLCLFFFLEKHIAVYHDCYLKMFPLTCINRDAAAAAFSQPTRFSFSSQLRKTGEEQEFSSVAAAPPARHSES